MKTTKGRKKKVKLTFKGDVHQDDLLIGSHGDTEIKARGNLQLSGIVYSPKYSVTLDIKGDGKISFRGKCYRIIIKKMAGNCTLDLTDVTYKELSCQSIEDKCVVIAGNTRAITPAFLSGDATLHVHERQLIFNAVTQGNSRVLCMNSAGVEEELNFKPITEETLEDI
jgi:hypothetical protein